MVSTSFGVDEPSTPIFFDFMDKLTLAILPANAFCSSVKEKFAKPLILITSSNIFVFRKSFGP